VFTLYSPTAAEERGEHREHHGQQAHLAVRRREVLLAAT
jgi:hypothetical protein